MEKKSKVCLFLIAGFIFIVPFSYAQPVDALEIKFKHENGIVTLESVTKTIAVLQQSQTGSFDYKYEILSEENKILYSAGFSVPLGSASDQVSYFNAYSPYSDASSVNLYRGEEIIDTIEIKAASSSSKVAWIYWVLPIAACIIFLGFLEVSRLKNHSHLEQSKINYRILGIQNFIASNLKKGFTKEQIRDSLLKLHSKEDTDAAFATIK